MTSLVTLKKEVKEIKQQTVGYKKPHYCRGLFPFGENGAWVRIKLVGSDIIFEPATKEEIHLATHNFYHRVILKHKHLAEKYPTFEDWWKDRARFGFK